MGDECLTWSDSTNTYFSYETKSCQPPTGIAYYVHRITIIVSWLVVLLVNFTMYAKIMKSVQSDSSLYNKWNSTLIAMRIRRRRQVAVMLVFNGVMFFICCTMINIFAIVICVTSLYDISYYKIAIFVGPTYYVQ